MILIVIVIVILIVIVIAIDSTRRIRAAEVYPLISQKFLETRGISCSSLIIVIIVIVIDGTRSYPLISRENS